MANIDAIKNLKETTKNSFDDREKEAVSKISVDDMRGAKAAIESKTFNIDGSSVSLKNIVLGLAVSPDWSGATYKWKKIEAKSELWAALQTLLMINWKSIWASSIDGTIWPRSATSLQQLQSEMKSADNVRRATEIQQQASERVTMSWLKQFPLGRSFDGVKAGTFNRFKNMQLLNGDWCLRSASIVGTKCTIFYKAEYNNSSKSIVVDVSKNAYGEVDVRKFVKDIVAKVDAEEKALKLKDAWDKMVAWINSFKESDISNPVVRKRASLKGVDFRWEINDSKRVTLSSKNDAIKRYAFNPESYVKNWVFDKVAFNKALTRNYYSEALPVVRDSLQKTLKGISIVRVSSLDENAAGWYVKALDQWRKTIKEYGRDFNDIDAAYLAKRNEIQHQKNYVSTKTNINANAFKIRSLTWSWLGSNVDSNKLATNFDSIMTELKKIVLVEKKGAGHYAINYNTNKRWYFEKVGKKDEYNKIVDSIVDVINGKKINVWWETITYKIDKLNR